MAVGFMLRRQRARPFRWCWHGGQAQDPRWLAVPIAAAQLQAEALNDETLVWTVRSLCMCPPKT